jgi:hypothetical protein
MQAISKALSPIVLVAALAHSWIASFSKTSVVFGGVMLMVSIYMTVFLRRRARRQEAILIDVVANSPPESGGSYADYAAIGLAVLLVAMAIVLPMTQGW